MHMSEIAMVTSHFASESYLIFKRKKCYFKGRQHLFIIWVVVKTVATQSGLNNRRGPVFKRIMHLSVMVSPATAVRVSSGCLLKYEYSPTVNGKVKLYILMTSDYYVAVFLNWAFGMIILDSVLHLHFPAKNLHS